MTSIKKVKRLALVYYAPMWNSTPTAGLQIILNQKPSHIEIKGTGIKSYIHIKNQFQNNFWDGNSQELHDQDDWEWNQGQDDWDGVEDRVSRNREKKKKEQDRRRRRIEKAAFAGQCTIGLGPIKSESYDYFNKITGDFEEAKKMAAAEFLVGYLKYDHNDMSDTDISDTRISPKDDDILYVVMDSPEKVKNIRRRIADCRNPEIKTREYIPPQFFQRYTAMGRYAKERRNKEGNLKTQIRFIDNDVRLYIKRKGTDEPFEEVDMKEVEENGELPRIDHSAPWRKRMDHPKWRRTSPTQGKILLKSLAGERDGKRTQEGSKTENSARMEDHSRVRDSSGSADRERARKKKKNLAAESSSSSGESSSSDNSGSPTMGKTGDKEMNTTD